MTKHSHLIRSFDSDFKGLNPFTYSTVDHASVFNTKEVVCTDQCYKNMNRLIPEYKTKIKYHSTVASMRLKIQGEACILVENEDNADLYIYTGDELDISGQGIVIVKSDANKTFKVSFSAKVLIDKKLINNSVLNGSWEIEIF